MDKEIQDIYDNLTKHLQYLLDNAESKTLKEYLRTQTVQMIRSAIWAWMPMIQEGPHDIENISQLQRYMHKFRTAIDECLLSIDTDKDVNAKKEIELQATAIILNGLFLLANTITTKQQ